MPDSEFAKIQGFRSFASLWYDACEQIAKETSKDNLDNDIKLFTILRTMMLSPDKAVFIRSHKLNDFNVPNNKVLSTLNNKYKNSSHVSWNRISTPRSPTFRPVQKIKVAPHTPAPISYLNIGNSKIISYQKQIDVQDDCVFEPTELYNPNEKLYTVINDNFLTTLDNTCVLYPVSCEIVTMFATQSQNRINIKTFQELTGNMYQKLLAQRNQMK